MIQSYSYHPIKVSDHKGIKFSHSEALNTQTRKCLDSLLKIREQYEINLDSTLSDLLYLTIGGKKEFAASTLFTEMKVKSFDDRLSFAVATTSPKLIEGQEGFSSLYKEFTRQKSSSDDLNILLTRAKRAFNLGLLAHNSSEYESRDLLNREAIGTIEKIVENDKTLIELEDIAIFASYPGVNLIESQNHILTNLAVKIAEKYRTSALNGIEQQMRYGGPKRGYVSLFMTMSDTFTTYSNTLTSISSLPDFSDLTKIITYEASKVAYEYSKISQDLMCESSVILADIFRKNGLIEDAKMQLMVSKEMVTEGCLLFSAPRLSRQLSLLGDYKNAYHTAYFADLFDRFIIREIEKISSYGNFDSLQISINGIHLGLSWLTLAESGVSIDPTLGSIFEQRSFMLRKSHQAISTAIDVALNPSYWDSATDQCMQILRISAELIEAKCLWYAEPLLYKVYDRLSDSIMYQNSDGMNSVEDVIYFLGSLAGTTRNTLLFENLSHLVARNISRGVFKVGVLQTLTRDFAATAIDDSPIEEAVFDQDKSKEFLGYLVMPGWGQS